MSQETRRIELRDRIAAKIREANYRWRNGSDDDYYNSLAESVMELFPYVAESPWLREGYVVADVREGGETWPQRS